MRQLIHEIHRRSLWQVLGIYVVGGWVVYEVVQSLTEGLGLPAWFPGLAVVLLLIGLPIVMATAFVQEGGPTAQRSATGLIDATGQTIERLRRAPGSASPVRHLFTWRNAIAGGVATFALWGVVAAAWLVFGDGSVRADDDSPSTRASLAILPFANLSPDPDNAYFAAGIHEEILTHLSRIAGIKLISRTSVLRYEDSEKSLSEIAGELGVSTILEGSVRRAGDQVRITAQLIDAASDEHLWAASYDRPLSVDNLLDLQTEVATRVAEELKGVLAPEERTELSQRPTEDLEAYGYYLRGHEHFRTLFDESEALAAAAAYQRAVELDPEFAAALARLVQTHLWLAWIWGHPEQRPLARAALDRLETIAPDTPELHFARGIWLYWGAQRYEESLREFDVLSEQWPNNFDVFFYQGAILRRLGRSEEGARAWVAALELDPANASLAEQLGESYTGQRRFEDAERFASLAVSLDPTVPVHWWLLVYTRVSRGDMEAARSAVDSARQQLGRERLESGGWWALWQVHTGRVGEVLDLYRQIYGDPGSWDGTWGRSWELGLAGAAAQGQSEAVTDLAETLRRGSEEALASTPTEVVTVRSRMLAALALAHAYLGDEEAAVRLAREAVELVPVSRDANWGVGLIQAQAHVLAVVGRPDEAVERLQYLLSVPGQGVTVPLLRTDPRWDPLRDHPGFQALLEEHSQ